MTAFEKAWEVVKGQSSDFDWFRPGWKRQIESANEMKSVLGDKIPLSSLTGETNHQVIDRFTQEDIQSDAMDNPNPAVNDALESIGEPNLFSRRSGGSSFGNKVGAELQNLNRRRREDWPDLSSRHPDVIE